MTGEIIETVLISNKDYKTLVQERDELKFENDRYKQLLKGCPTEDEDCGLCVIDEQNKRLKQENKQMKSALEEINLILDELKQQYDYMTDYVEIKEIQDKINEALQDD